MFISDYLSSSPTDEVVKRVFLGNLLAAILLMGCLAEDKRLLDNLPQHCGESLSSLIGHFLALRVEDKLLVVPVVKRGLGIAGELVDGMWYIRVRPCMDPVWSASQVS